MPYGKPKLVTPWSRDNWDRLNFGQKRYGLQEYQCQLVRRGERIPNIPLEFANQLRCSTEFICAKALNMLQHWFPDVPVLRNARQARDPVADGERPRGTRAPTDSGDADTVDESEEEVANSEEEDSERNRSILLGRDGHRGGLGKHRELESESKSTRKLGPRIDATDQLLAGQQVEAFLEDDVREPYAPVTSPVSSDSGSSGTSATGLKDDECIDGSDLDQDAINNLFDLLEGKDFCVHNCSHKIHIIINDG